MKGLSFSVLSFIIVSIYSCEGYRCGNGIVKDKVTNLPFDSVLCTVLTGTNKVYTDCKGMFEVCNNFGSCASGCKDIVIEFSKNGYRSTRIENPAQDEIIFLEQ